MKHGFGVGELYFASAVYRYIYECETETSDGDITTRTEEDESSEQNINDNTNDGIWSVRSLYGWAICFEETIQV
jgi:hypothetical protein